jgi:hypothetical protein
MRRTVGLLQYLHLRYFSRPRHDRLLYANLLKRGPYRKILEIGVTDLVTPLRLIRLSMGIHGKETIYTGIDLFEARPSSAPSGLNLKGAYQRLRESGAVIRLVPGDPYAALRRSANEIGPVDLLIIRSGIDQQSMERAWFYVPRLLHEKTRIVQEVPADSPNQWALRDICPSEVASLAGTERRRSAA